MIECTLKRMSFNMEDFDFEDFEKRILQLQVKNLCGFFKKSTGR